METASILEFRRLNKEMGWGLIPLNGKRPVERDWTRWCQERRPFNPNEFVGKNAGIPCGPANGVIVIDVDDLEKFNKIRQEKGWKLPVTRRHRTGGGGAHYFYRYPSNGHRYVCRSFKKQGFDIRADGGQVVAPGSIHPETGEPYEVDFDEPIALAPDWLLELCKDNGQDPPISEKGTTQGGGRDLDGLPLSLPVKELIKRGAPKGERSEAFFSVLQALLKAKVSYETIVAIFEHYPVGEKYREKGQTRERWLQGEIKRAQSKIGKEPGHITGRLDAFLKEIGPDFVFDHERLYRELSIRDRKSRSALWVALHRRVKEGKIKRLPHRPGWFQVVDQHLKPMNLKARNLQDLNLRLPLDEHDLVKFYPGNTILVAGDPNSGKTAYALNVAQDNLDGWHVHYFNSEMGEEELIERLSLFPEWPWEHPNFNAYERSSDFASVLRKGKQDLNIIDYLEISENFYQISGLLNEIHSNLGEAIALVVVQKANPQTDLPLGGYRGLEKPRLVISLSAAGIAKIIKAKNWKDPGLNPNGLRRQFKLVQGCKFLPQGRWRKPLS